MVDSDAGLNGCTAGEMLRVVTNERENRSEFCVDEVLLKWRFAAHGACRMAD